MPTELDLIIEREKYLKEEFEKEESTKTVENVFKTALQEYSFDNHIKLNNLMLKTDALEQIMLGLPFNAVRELTHFHFRKNVPFVDYIG